MNKKLFDKSNKIEKITFIFDFLAIAAYLALFLIFFGMLELPEIINGRMDLDNLQYMLPTYEFLSATFDSLISYFLIKFIN